ncbi:hypothetical protein CcaCcLH18_14031 [Colletotrichum camelliae]|nr:hypothetical protein CcaCcLH18_14031 [Colletotrichum camelliae]
MENAFRRFMRHRAKDCVASPDVSNRVRVRMTMASKGARVPLDFSQLSKPQQKTTDNSSKVAKDGASGLHIYQQRSSQDEYLNSIVNFVIPALFTLTYRLEHVSQIRSLSEHHIKWPSLEQVLGADAGVLSHSSPAAIRRAAPYRGHRAFEPPHLNFQAQPNSAKSRCLAHTMEPSGPIDLKWTASARGAWRLTACKIKCDPAMANHLVLCGSGVFTGYKACTIC